MISGYRAILQIWDRRNSSHTSGTNKNVESKNVYIKADFNTYNIVVVNMGASASDTSITSKEIVNNKNNKGIYWSNMMSGVNKSKLSITKKCAVNQTDIEVGIEFGQANINIANGADIAAGKELVQELLQVLTIV